jgi:hypothetical protein
MDVTMTGAAPARLTLEEKLLLCAIGYFVVVRLAFSFGAFPIGDEAYYWMWGRHPALSFYDHPPLQAWLQGLSHAIFGRSLFALRWMTAACLAVNLWIFYLIAKRVAGSRWRSFFLKSATIYLASPLYGFFTAAALHDYLLVTLVLASGYAFIRFFADVEQTGRGRSRDLFVAAALLGLATLTKYNGAFLGIAAAGTILLHPKLRRLLLDWRLYVAALLAVAMQLPVILWNVEQGFASFGYQMGSRHGTGLAGVNIAGMKAFAGEALIMVSPFLVPVIILFFWARQRDAFERMAKTLAIWAFWLSTLTCLYISNFSWVIWWWNIVAFVLVFPFAARYAHPVLLWLHVAWGALVTTIFVFSFTIVPVQALLGQMPGMETERSFGWEQLAPAMLSAREEHGADFLATNRFHTASELAFALDDPTVVSITPVREAFDDWVDWEALAGKDAIVLVETRTDTETFKKSFAAVEELGEITTTRFGYPINVFRLYVARGFVPPGR